MLRSSVEFVFEEAPNKGTCAPRWRGEPISYENLMDQTKTTFSQKKHLTFSAAAQWNGKLALKRIPNTAVY